MHYKSCPFCGSARILELLTAKDHTVSGQTFPIYKCDECTGAFTQNAPSEDDISAFYKSDNYISHSDTQEGLINRLYHKVRKKTLQDKLRLVKKQTRLSTGKILDIGCGTGAFLHTMQQAGWDVTGLEPDLDARENAERLYQISPHPSGDLFHLHEGSYDAITMWHVLEHVHDLHEYIDQVKKLLKPKGILIVAVPNYTSCDAGKYNTYWAAYDVPRHLYHFSPGCMRMLMKDHGLQVVKTVPMWFDSFYVAMLSEKYKYGVENPLAAVWTGVISNMKALANRDKCSSLVYVVKK